MIGTTMRRALAVAAAAMAVAALGAVATPTPAAADAVCGRSGGAPVITLPPNVIAVGQTPGRQLIGYTLLGRDVVLIVVDDAHGLRHDQVRIQVDIDPVGPPGTDGVQWTKALEFWSFCRGTRAATIQSWMTGGFNVGTACFPLAAANNFRSGCTNPQDVILQRSQASEVWLRKPGFLGIWTDAEAIDSSFWDAFGGRVVRFIWRAD